MKRNVDSKDHTISQHGITRVIRNIFFNRKSFEESTTLWDKFEQFWHSQVICCDTCISKKSRDRVRKHKNRLNNA